MQQQQQVLTLARQPAAQEPRALRLWLPAQLPASAPPLEQEANLVMNEAAEVLSIRQQDKQARRKSGRLADVHVSYQGTSAEPKQRKRRRINREARARRLQRALQDEQQAQRDAVERAMGDEIEIELAPNDPDATRLKRDMIYVRPAGRDGALTRLDEEIELVSHRGVILSMAADSPQATEPAAVLLDGAAHGAGGSRVLAEGERVPANQAGFVMTVPASLYHFFIRLAEQNIARGLQAPGTQYNAPILRAIEQAVGLSVPWPAAQERQRQLLEQRAEHQWGPGQRLADDNAPPRLQLVRDEPGGGDPPGPGTLTVAVTPPPPDDLQQRTLQMMLRNPFEGGDGDGDGGDDGDDAGPVYRAPRLGARDFTLLPPDAEPQPPPVLLLEGPVQHGKKRPQQQDAPTVNKIHHRRKWRQLNDPNDENRDYAPPTAEPPSRDLVPMENVRTTKLTRPLEENEDDDAIGQLVRLGKKPRAPQNTEPIIEEIVEQAQPPVLQLPGPTRQRMRYEFEEDFAPPEPKHPRPEERTRHRLEETITEATRELVENVATVEQTVPETVTREEVPPPRTAVVIRGPEEERVDGEFVQRRATRAQLAQWQRELNETRVLVPQTATVEQTIPDVVVREEVPPPRTDVVIVEPPPPAPPPVRQTRVRDRDREPPRDPSRTIVIEAPPPLPPPPIRTTHVIPVVTVAEPSPPPFPPPPPPGEPDDSSSSSTDDDNGGGGDGFVKIPREVIVRVPGGPVVPIDAPPTSAPPPPPPPPDDESSSSSSSSSSNSLPPSSMKRRMAQFEVVPPVVLHRVPLNPAQVPVSTPTVILPIRKRKPAPSKPAPAKRKPTPAKRKPRKKVKKTPAATLKPKPVIHKATLAPKRKASAKAKPKPKPVAAAKKPSRAASSKKRKASPAPVKKPAECSKPVLTKVTHTLCHHVGQHHPGCCCKITNIIVKQ